MITLLKEIALYLLVVLGVMYGYQYLTGKSIATLPREIVDKLQEKGPAKSTNLKYYRDPAENIPKE